MPEQLDDGEWSQLLHERDAFKLAIRGFAAIEGDLDAFIAEAFASPLPGGVRGLGGVDKRIAIAAALRLVPDSYLPCLRGLAKIRHDFAHGNIDVIPAERARALQDSLVAAGLMDADTLAFLRSAGPHY